MFVLTCCVYGETDRQTDTLFDVICGEQSDINGQLFSWRSPFFVTCCYELGFEWGWGWGVGDGGR